MCEFGKPRPNGFPGILSANSVTDANANANADADADANADANANANAD